MPTHAFTIAKLAEAAGIGVEAVRYYQRRGLLAQPGRAHGTFREYSPSDVRRLHFIKRAQELGFTLDDVAELASLSAEPDKQRVRDITQRRVQEIRQRVAHLQAIAGALEGLVGCCEQSTPADGCPIVAALAGASPSAQRIQSSPRGRRGAAVAA